MNFFDASPGPLLGAPASINETAVTGPPQATAPPSAAMSLLSLLKKPSEGVTGHPPSSTGPSSAEAKSLAEVEAAAKRQPLKYTPPARKQTAAPEAVDQHVLLHRLVTIIRSSEDAGITLKKVQENYRQQFPPLAKHRKLSDLLPPVAFHPHLVAQQLDGDEILFKFTSTPQSPPLAKSPPASPTRSPAPAPSPAATKPPRAVAMSEPVAVGQPRCGHLDFALQITGQSLRNARAVSVLLQTSLRAVVCRDGKTHSLSGGAIPTAQQHLVLINASLVLQPRENATLWYTPTERQSEVVDVTRNIEKTWAGASISSSEASTAHNLAQPVLSFSAANKTAWLGNVRNVWVLLSLPGRRLVTLKDGRLLLLGGLLKHNMHIGASSGSWHFPQGSARETEVCEEALSACKRAGLSIGPHDNNDRSLVWASEDKAKYSPDRVGKVQPCVAQSKSLVAAAFGDDSSSDDD